MYNEVIHFWFNELTPSDWFIDSIHIDQIIIERFGSLHKQAVQGELYEWRFSPQGGLVEIIILDQFSRNIHRGHSKSFDNDGMALVLAQNMIEKQQDKQLIPNMKAFCYLPFMHSESQIIHKNALELGIMTSRGQIRHASAFFLSFCLLIPQIISRFSIRISTIIRYTFA